MDEDKKEEPKEGKDGEEGEQGEDEEDGDGIGARTTRSKTAPQRRKSPEIAPRKHGVFTLSDVHACRAILAEKANQHWMKGLGGGQNREGETIVNFLYKNKVGHGEYSSARGRRQKLTFQVVSCAFTILHRHRSRDSYA
jgi:hypothetical protein